MEATEVREQDAVGEESGWEKSRTDPGWQIPFPLSPKVGWGVAWSHSYPKLCFLLSVCLGGKEQRCHRGEISYFLFSLNAASFGKLSNFKWLLLRFWVVQGREKRRVSTWSDILSVAIFKACRPTLVLFCWPQKTTTFVGIHLWHTISDPTSQAHRAWTWFVASQALEVPESTSSFPPGSPNHQPNIVQQF